MTVFGKIEFAVGPPGEINSVANILIEICTLTFKRGLTQTTGRFEKTFFILN